jgi:hypothetical protein
MAYFLKARNVEAEKQPLHATVDEVSGYVTRTAVVG